MFFKIKIGSFDVGGNKWEMHFIIFGNEESILPV